RDCRFGARRLLFGRIASEGAIYDRLDLSNNVYDRIRPDLRVRRDVEDALAFDLASVPFTLVQARARRIVVRSTDQVPTKQLVQELARRQRVVLLGFDSGRALDSTSDLPAMPDTRLYRCASFLEQACLVHFARRCVFLTEGDFGSHIYVPPFMGRNVVAIAPASIFKLGTTPIEFWNERVFRFGGQIRPVTVEDLFSSPDSLQRRLDDLLSC